MATKFYIADESRYKEEINKYFESILNGRLMSIRPSLLSDDDVMAFITDYDKSVKERINNYCTWLTIGDVKQSNYNEKDFYHVDLLSNDEFVEQINFSQFLYEMSPFDRDLSLFPKFDPSRAQFLCLVDGRMINPNIFFEKNRGKKMLLYYSFPAVTAFNKEKNCYYFAFENISPSDVRHFILFSQKNALKYIIKSPAAYAPGTTIVQEFEEYPNLEPVYNHDATSECTQTFVNKIFNQDFRESFQKRLDEIEDEYDKI